MRALALALAFCACSLASPASAQVRQPSPVVERIEPSSGPPGTSVEMVGRYFRPDQSVQIGEQALEVVSRMPNRWTVRVPAGTRSGRVVVRVEGLPPIEGPEFRVLAAPPAPVITDVQPRTAAPGAEVRILGENFSPRPAEDLVTLGAVPVVVSRSNPTELVVIVPQGALTGRFSVRVAGSGEATAPVDLTLGAGLSVATFLPAVGPPSSRVELTGAGFSTRATENRVFLGRAPCRVLASTATTLSIEVPAQAASGVFQVEVRGVGRVYSAAPFTVQPMPTISALEPSAGPPGAQFTIRGAHFGGDVRLVQVTVGGVAATVRGLREGRELVVEVPSTAQAGPVEVSVNSVGPARAAQAFTVLVPLGVTGFAPRSGGPGTEVLLSGQGFSTTLTENRVTLSGAPCEVVSSTPTQLRVRVPQTTSGPLLVDVTNAGSGRTSQPFVVTTPPRVQSFEPTQGEPGSTLTLRGEAFGTNASLLEVMLGDARMEVRSASEREIVAVVPAGATSARLRVTVRLQGSSSPEGEFLVIGPFALTAVEPASTFAGQWVTLRGIGFGTRAAVRFSGVEAPVTTMRTGPTELRAVVPTGAVTGPVTVRSEDGREVSSALELVPPPPGLGITSVEPVCLQGGCAVVLRGHGFGTRPNQQTVTIGTARARVRRATPTALEFDLPRTPGTMTIRVERSGRGGGRAETAPLTIEAPAPAR